MDCTSWSTRANLIVPVVSFTAMRGMICEKAAQRARCSAVTGEPGTSASCSSFSKTVTMPDTVGVSSWQQFEEKFRAPVSYQHQIASRTCEGQTIARPSSRPA